MNIKKIYIDMDGVVADFDNGLRKLIGLEPEPQGKQTDEYQEKMWKGIKECEHFYLDLDPLEGAVEGFKKLYEKYGDACEILSAYPKAFRGVVNAREDKIVWVKKYLSEDVKINLGLRAEKKRFAEGKDCILIDDYKVNTDEWEKAGGTAILFTSWDKLFEQIDELL